MAIALTTDIPTSVTIPNISANNSQDSLFKRNYIALRSNPILTNESWIGIECHACKGWSPKKDKKGKIIEEQKQIGPNLTILPLSAVLLLLLGLCANMVNWFHSDVRMSKHKEYLSPNNQIHNHCSPSTSKRMNPEEENLLLASSKSSSYTSIFTSLEPHIIAGTSTDPDAACGTRPKRDRCASLRKSPNNRPKMNRRINSERKLLNTADSNTVPVVMYLDKNKIQRQVLRHLERQDSRSRLLATMSHSDLTRKQSNASSGYTSSVPDSCTDSQQDISNATSISELCSDKVNSPIRVMSPATCDNLIIGNLISKSSFLLNIPTAMSPKQKRYSTSPNGYIEDCFIFPGSSSNGSSMDRFSGAVSPAASDPTSTPGYSSGTQSMTQSQQLSSGQLSPVDDVSDAKRSYRACINESSSDTQKEPYCGKANNATTPDIQSSKRLRKAYRARPSVSFDDEMHFRDYPKDYYKLARISKYADENYKTDAEKPLLDCVSSDSITTSFIQGKGQEILARQGKLTESPDKASNSKCIWVIGENFDSDSLKDSEDGRVEYYV